MKVSRRALLAGSSAAFAQAQPRRRVPSWKPRLGVLGNYSEANLEFVKAEGFTSMELNLDPKKLDDNAIAAIKDKLAKAGIWVSSLNVGGNHIDPDPAKREQRISTPSSASSCAASWGFRRSAGNPAPSRDNLWPSKSTK